MTREMESSSFAWRHRRLKRECSFENRILDHSFPPNKPHFVRLSRCMDHIQVKCQITVMIHDFVLIQGNCSLCQVIPGALSISGALQIRLEVSIRDAFTRGFSRIFSCQMKNIV